MRNQRCVGVDEENMWWQEFADFANKQWLLSTPLNFIIRSDYLQEMIDYLFIKDGKVLDLGCGTGWVGLLLVAKGMHLTGVDFSTAQIDAARREAAKFDHINATFVHGELTAIKGRSFDRAIVHATLHHFPEDEMDPFLRELYDLLKEGGRLYLYEPLAPKRDGSLFQLLAWILFLIVYGPWYLLHWLAVRLRIGPYAFRQATRAGWMGLSPVERPLDKHKLLARLERAGFSVVEEAKYWHAYSLAFAMGCTELGPSPSRIANVYVRFLYSLDRVILSGPLREYIFGVWTFASILAEKDTSG